jgi:hypothetical protein
MNKKNLLTVLGCSGSITLALMGNQPAQANTALDFTFVAPNVREAEIAEITKPLDSLIDCTCSNYNASLMNNDQLGDLAISQWGCDCAGCRNITLSMVESGQITLPQS